MAVRSTQGQNRAVRSTPGGRGCHPHNWFLFSVYSKNFTLVRVKFH